MKKEIFAVTLLLSLYVNASPIAEKPIPDTVKNRIASTLKNGMQKSEISESQFNDAMQWLNSTPCKGVDRDFKESSGKKLARVIANQELVPKVEVHQSFKYKNWLILFVSTFDGEDSYLFYSKNADPSHHSVARWSGTATMLETTEVKEWVLQNAPGIPESLASCFAWHVTFNLY